MIPGGLLLSPAPYHLHTSPSCYRLNHSIDFTNVWPLAMTAGSMSSCCGDLSSKHDESMSLRPSWSQCSCDYLHETLTRWGSLAFLVEGGLVQEVRPSMRDSPCCPLWEPKEHRTLPFQMIYTLAIAEVGTLFLGGIAAYKSVMLLEVSFSYHFCK